jgi:hypothetical protein
LKSDSKKIPGTLIPEIQAGIGYCLIECSVGWVGVGWVEDDEFSTNFETLLCQIKPKEILCSKVNKIFFFLVF